MLGLVGGETSAAAVVTPAEHHAATASTSPARTTGTSPMRAQHLFDSLDERIIE
jgi:hypothetical protein